MNNLAHNDRLLADVLGEGVSAGFREDLLNGTLRLARRRRRLRQARRAVPALALVAALGLLLWHLSPSGRIPSDAPAKPDWLVRSWPLPPAALVQTKPFPASCLVASASTGNTVLTAKAGVRAREIGDDELLALVPTPAALVRCGPHCAELVFVNAEDREALFWH